MNRTILRRGALSALLLCSVAAGAARAEYPDHPVTVVVAFAPGGMTDIVARLLSAELGKRFKQTFVVENKPGAAGQIGTELVARQKNDGYTLLVSATGHVIVRRSMTESATTPSATLPRSASWHARRTWWWSMPACRSIPSPNFLHGGKLNRACLTARRVSGGRPIWAASG